jgi:ABC-type nitrate/sulfonate/bicarbonate transport system substrate-binding protein
MKLQFRTVTLPLVAATMVGTASFAQDLTPVTMGFAIDSIVQQIPYHVALEHGYFEDEGLDMTFEFLAGSSSLVQQIIAGNVDTGSPAWGAVFNGIVQGHDLDVYMSWQYKSVFTLATPADAGIETVADLDGKAVGVSDLSGGEVPIVRAVLREVGLTEGEDVQLIPVGEGSALTVNALQTGQVQAYSSNMFDVAAIRAAGIPMNVIMPASVENFPGNSLVAMADRLEEDREVFQGIARAMARAIVYVENNPEEALELAKQLRPEQLEDPELTSASWEAAYDLRERPDDMPADAPIGVHYRPGIQAYHDFLRQGSEEEGALLEDIDIETILDDSFIEFANDFEKEAAARPRAEQ